MFALPIRCDNDKLYFIFVLPKATNSQLNLPHGIKKTENAMKRTKNKNRVAQKKRSSYESVESVLRPEESL